jgi:hypothetical protein
LFRSPDGVELRVTDGGKERTGVTLAVQAPDGKLLCCLALSADGAVAVCGSTVSIKAPEISIEGKAGVKGSINVAKKGDK